MDHKNNIWYVFRAYPHDTELHTDHELLHKFWLSNGKHSVLEDHSGELRGLSPEDFARKVSSLNKSSRRVVVNADDLQNGAIAPPADALHQPLHEAVQTQLAGGKGPKISEFQYHRTGMPAPQHLKLHGHQVFMDEQALSPEEIGQVFDNIQTGQATLRHHVSPEPMKKTEPVLADAINQADPSAVQDLNIHFYQDTLVPEVGNLAAYRGYIQTPCFVICAKLMGFHTVRSSFGHSAADQSIIAFNRAALKAADEAVGHNKSRVFHYAGSETRVCVPSMEDAEMFVRAFRTKLESIPALRGVFQFNAAIGVAPDESAASQAMHRVEQMPNPAIPGTQVEFVKPPEQPV